MGHLLDALKQFEAKDPEAAPPEADASEQSIDTPEKAADSTPPAEANATSAPPSSQDIPAQVTQLLSNVSSTVDQDLHIPGVQTPAEGLVSVSDDQNVASDEKPHSGNEEIVGEEVADEAESDTGNDATGLEEGSGHDLIDDLKTTIQCELDREEFEENDEARDSLYDSHVEATPSDAESGPGFSTVVFTDSKLEKADERQAADPLVGHVAASSEPAHAPADDVPPESESAADVNQHNADRVVLAAESSPEPASTVEAADEFRQLAKNVDAQWKGDQTPTLLIAPAEPAGNVTSVVVQLGHALSQNAAGSILVLGVDHAAEATSNLGSDGQPSWTDILAGKGDWREKIRPTGIAGLELLAAPVATALAARRGPEQFGVLLSKMRGQYRIVLIDGSGVETAELQALATCCAGVYLVVTLRHTAEKTAKATLKQLKAADARVMGCIAAGAGQ